MAISFRAALRRRHRSAALAAAALLLCRAAAAQESAAPGTGAAQSESVAAIGGQKVTRAELEDYVASDLMRLRQERQDVLEKGLDRYLTTEVLTRESKARGISVAELLDKEVLPHAKPPTDAEVDAFYERNKDRIEGTKEQVAPKVKEYLAQQRRQTALDTYTSSLKEKYGVKVLLEPLRIPVDARDAPARGAAAAPVTLVEFGDFQCPYCRALEPTLEKVLKNYAGKVRLEFRQFPLSGHPQAAKAAEASLCAREQDKFWELHDRMYGHQEALKVDQLKTAAGELGLDTERFGQCVDSGKYEPNVKADLLAGSHAGVTGTPALYVNGRPVPGGAVDYDVLAKFIDDELKRVARN
jgi:protein-disulfide isomerase